MISFFNTNTKNVPKFVPQFIDPAQANTQTTMRVTEYFLLGGAFTGASYTLTLDQDLADDYFVIVEGSDGDGTSSGGRGPDENYIALTADPNGTGDLSASGASDELDFVRGNAVDTWIGAVKVVECLVDCENSGFELLDVQRVVHSGTGTSGTDTSGTAWSDINQVALIGGYHGSGCNTAETSNGNQKVCHARIYPSATSTINWSRSSNLVTLSTATSTVHVVEWGDEWNVQRVNVTGSSGGNGANVAGEYDSATISSVTRDNTLVWGTGHAEGDGIGEASEGALITLGNGQTQSLVETQVSVGMEYSISKNFEVYAFEHPDLAVDYRFKADGDSTNLAVDVTVDTNTATTNRMALVTNGQNGQGTAYPRPNIASGYINNTTVRLNRRRSGQAFPAWLQGINFSAIQSPEYTQSNWRLYTNTDSTDVGIAAPQNTPATVPSFGDPFRLRLLLGFTEAQAPQSLYDFKLQYAVESGTCDTSFTGETYADVTTSTPIAYNNNPTPADGDNLTANASDPTSGNTINNQDYEELNDFTNTVSDILEGEDGLWDFALLDNTSSAETYCLRVVEADGTLLDIYNQVPEVSTPGFLGVDIVNGGGNSIANPSVSFSSIAVSYNDQVTTGSLSILIERIRVSNTTTNPQWSLSIAASSGTTAFWDGTSSDFDFNDPTANANDGPDPDSLGGAINY